MATKTIDDSPQLQPAESRAYRDDLFGWVEDQVALLKAGRVAEIDFVNIADELGDVGNEQCDKLESAIRIVLLHLLKWDQQPERRSRNWVLSVSEHRRRIQRVLKKNPSLKPSIDEAISGAYEDARGDAVGETNLPNAAIPAHFPYDWNTILNRLVEFNDTRSPES